MPNWKPKQEEGEYLSENRLAKAAHVGNEMARQFLGTQRAATGQPPTYERHADPLAHVARVYAELEARGEQVTSYKQLMKVAHVTGKTAIQFMHMRKGTEKCDQQKLHQELHGRFAQVYAKLEARGERITAKRIADVAQHKKATAEKYLHALREGGAVKQQAETRHWTTKPSLYTETITGYNGLVEKKKRERRCLA